MKTRNISKRTGWTILMVDVNGQIKTIKYLRAKTIFGLLICFLAVLSTLVIGQMYYQALKENKALYETLAIKRAVFGEKGIIRMPCQQPDNDIKIASKLSVYSDSCYRPLFSNPYHFEPAIDFNLSTSLDVIPDMPTEIVKNVLYDKKVQATDIKMIINKANRRIGFSFILRNTVKAKKPISGTSFIVLKNDHDSMAYPAIKLRRGRPVNFRKGRPFYVSRFKTVRHRLNDIENFEEYTEATILVYSQNGRLLIDKDIPIHMSL